MMHFGALEAGGTKMVLSLMDENGTMLERVSMPTLTPAETMPGMIDFFRERHIAALGIGCFGPLDLRPDSPTYGYITSTPKLPWRNYPIVGAFREALGVPVKLDTDVNGAAIAEQALGAAKGLGSCVYVTVGTGIGGGVVLDGKPVHGAGAPGVWASADGYCARRSHARRRMPPITRAAWKAWRPARRSRSAGAVRRWSCPRSIPPGSWRPPIWRRCASTPCSPSPRKRSSWAAA